jgi:hypothetical protein
VHDLNAAHDKLRWAKRHFDVLRRQVEPFEQRDAHRISCEVDPDAGEYTFYVHGLEVPDPDWGLMIGDVLHNARTALDYVMVQLWALTTGQDPKDVTGVQFPIYSDPKKFAGSVGELRKNAAFSGYLAEIEKLQLFNAQNASIWGFGPAWGTRDPSLPYALDRLSSLDNIDKHRVVHATWVGLAFGGHLDPARDAPASFKSIGGTTGPVVELEDGAQVGTWRFESPLPEKWEPTEMQMKGYFPLEVAFPDPSLVKGVLKILPWCIWGAEAVLTMFQPVFAHGDAPLPVTAVGWPAGA